MNELKSSAATKRRHWTWRRRILVAAGLLTALVAGIASIATWQLRASLPQLDGQIVLAGCEYPISINRDDLGIPAIKAQTRNDAAFATGFLHAQERFFQMDLLRRVSSGRLSELLGKAALENDRAIRIHRLHQVAMQVTEDLPLDAREMLDAYTLGVNQGLQKLGSRPPEYWLLRQVPAPWESADSICVMLSMMCDLQDENGTRKLDWGELAEKVPVEVFDFLARVGSTWDAPLDNSILPAVPIPSPEVWSLRIDERSRSERPRSFSLREKALEPHFHDGDAIGSNQWGISGDLVRGRAGMLASDMHLGLRIPTTWYRVLLEEPNWIVGVTLPGTPLIICGSNRHVAWGFTNSYADFGDVVELKMVPDQQGYYETPDGNEALTIYRETISYPGGRETVSYEWSRWGPVVKQDGERRFVHRWVGHDAEAFDVNLWAFESTTSVTELLDAANRAGMPHNNVMAVDSAGQVGWTVCGRFPKRLQPCSVVPQDWSQPGTGWDGYRAPHEIPRREIATNGRLWTANNRVVGGEELKLLGTQGYDPGARATQIRDRLLEAETFDERDFLAIQRDHEAKFLKSWQERLLDVARSDATPLSSEAVSFVEKWGEAASIDSVGYRIVNGFRARVLQVMTEAIEKRAGLKGKPILSLEGVTVQLLDERPLHWLPEPYESWDSLLADAARWVEVELTKTGPLAAATWGARNRSAVDHPISRSVPWLGSWLNMPSVELPGDRHMPLVQGPSFGASMRMVVVPGEEERGIYHQPGGQSGHFLSPFYRAGFMDWANGTPSPLLPGPARHRLDLIPGK